MNSYEAKQGFLTFVTTAVVAVGIFTSMYFLINNLNDRAQNEVSKNDLTTRITPQVNGTTDSTIPAPAVAPYNPTTTPTPVAQTTGTVFGALVENKTEQKKVLGAADQSTGSAVPSTGSSSLSALILVGGSLVLLGSYLSLGQPRKAALKAFEKRITKGL